MSEDGPPILDDPELDAIISKGGEKLAEYMTGIIELTRRAERAAVVIIGKERDVDGMSAQLAHLREQTAFLRRNIDETHANQDLLKDSIDNMTTQKNNMAEREAMNRDQIASFEEKYEELKAIADAGSGWKPDQSDERIALERERGFLTSRLENKTNQVNSLRLEIDNIYGMINSLETQLADDEKRVIDIAKKTNEVNRTAIDLKKKKDEFESRLTALREMLVKTEHDLEETQAKLSMDQHGLSKLEGKVNTHKEELEASVQQYEALYRTLQELTTECERQLHTNKKVAGELEENRKYVTERRKENDWLLKETDKVAKLREVADKTSEEIEAEKQGYETKRDELNRKVAVIRDVEIAVIRREIESQDKQLAALKSELDVVKKRYGKGEKATKALHSLIQLNVVGKKNLLVELKSLEDDCDRQKMDVRLILQEKDKLDMDVEVSNQRYYTSLEELKLQELQISELQKKITEDQAKLKHKQNLYDAVRSDRNLYHKQLSDCQDEIGILRRKFRGTNHLIEQLKDEISVKDNALVKEHFMHHSVDRERELLKNELTKIRKQIESSENIIANQKMEILKLTRIIEEAETERARQHGELAGIVSERNLLTNQVVKRNYELNQLYDKIKSQRSDLIIGERQYNRIAEQTMEWQRQLVGTLHEHNDTVKSLVGMDKARTTIVRLEKEILKEQGKVRALSDELTRPINIHRWRKLESSDPQRFEMISTIQNMQKAIMTKTEDIAKHEQMITEKEKIYTELKLVIARQPGPEIEEQILVYQQTYKDKAKQLAAMDEELAMYRQQVSVFKEEIAEIDGETKRVNKMWVKQQQSQRRPTTSNNL